MKIAFLTFLVLFSFTSKAQDASILETERNINTFLVKQKNAFVHDLKANRQIFSKIKALPSGQIVILNASENSDTITPLTLDLLAAKTWEINEALAILKDKKGELLVSIYGIDQAEIQYLKTQFELLQSHFVAYIAKKKVAEIEARKAMIKKRDDLPDPKLEAKRIKAEKEARKAFENNKSKN